ncbi:SEC-C domain-containing protein [Myxococcota bacterium]|nr:SEC-C domain-containing protein [Myxococcota bacterium]
MGAVRSDPDRNLPCPCGSRQKFKRCHGREGRRFADVLIGLNAAIAQLREAEESESRRVARFGEGRPLIHAEFKGHKLVAIGSEVRHAKEWRTFPDFLHDYVVQLLGEAWFNAELSRPIHDRHPVMAWRWGHYEAAKKLVPGPDGLLVSIPTGDEAALLTLANDLFVLRHNGAFQDDILDRLRHRDQFAGARYELFAASTCVRAGLTVRHEDERDRSRRHVEFIATDANLGLQLAVEAKQRQRKGRRRAVPGTDRPDVTTLVNKALEKRPGMPMVVFVDVDMDPPPVGDAAWISRLETEIRKEMARVEANAKGPLAANMVVVTSIAYWRAGALPAPATMFYSHVPTQDQFPVSDAVLCRLCEAAAKHRNIPNDLLGTAQQVEFVNQPPGSTS